MSRSAVSVRTDNPVINGKAAFVDVARVDRCNQCAIGFFVVMAVAKTAIPEKRAKFWEGAFNFLPVEVTEAEFLQAGRVDQMAVDVEVVEGGVGGRVLAGVEGLRNFAGGGSSLGDERIDQRRFAHAGLVW